MKVTAIQIKPYHTKNTLMKLNHNSKTSLIISKNMIHENLINNSN